MSFSSMFFLFTLGCSSRREKSGVVEEVFYDSIKVVSLLFSCWSDDLRLESSKQSLIMLTIMTKMRGGALVGFPPVIEIGTIICSAQIIR